MSSAVAAWPMVALGEVLTERAETPLLGTIESGEMPVVAKIGFHSGEIALRTDSETKTGMIVVRPGDLLISGINAAKGAVAIYSRSNSRPIAATIHYGAYIPNLDRIDVTFLWWLLRSPLFRTILHSHVPGGIKTELKARRFLAIPIPYPPLQEQQRIVRCIAELAKRIDEARGYRNQAYAEIDNLLPAAIYQAFANFTDVDDFGQVVTFKPRSGPSFPTDVTWTGLPVLMPSSVTGFGVDTSKIERGPGNERISSKDLLSPGDILIARGNKREQVGNAGVVPPSAAGWVSANLLMRLRIDASRIDPFFCIYWLRSPQIRALVKARMTGTNPNIQKINQRTILGLPFPVHVPLSTQQHIVDRLDDIRTKTEKLKRLHVEVVAECDALLPAVLDRAFHSQL
jgi:type I restriction enzyme S subunit